MAIICPKCGKQYDVTLFQFDKAILCECGEKVKGSQSHKGSLEDDCSSLPRKAARIKSMIADDEVPKSVILREIENLRSLYLECFPKDKAGFGGKYENGLRRLFRLARAEELLEDS